MSLCDAIFDGKPKELYGNFIVVNQEQQTFIISAQDKSPKEIIKLFNSKYNMFISERQIVDIMNKHKIGIKSFLNLLLLLLVLF